MNYLYAYLAGMIDADGSIYARLKKNKTHRYDFQIVPCVVVFQHQQYYQQLNEIQKQLGYGYIRARNDQMLELTFSKQKDIKNLVNNINPFLILKKNQAKLILSILEDMQTVKSAEEFINLAKRIDKFQKLNFSVKRKNNAQMVSDHLRSKGLLTP